MIAATVVEEIRSILEESDLERKLTAAARLTEARDRLGGARDSTDPLGIVRPGRPATWQVRDSREVRARPSLASERGRFLLLHSVAHIEVSAIELALMAVGDFPDAEIDYHRDMLRVAGEEVEHAHMLMERLRELGGELGSEPVHLHLWETAVESRTLPERLAVVPRILEAHGLDVSAGLRHKLRAAGDERSAACLDRVYADEIGHVAAGTHWYRRVCRHHGLDAERHFLELLARYRPRRGPVDLDGRRQAGFTEAELAALR